ncbi:hypothetical protein [Psychrobacillus sp. FSL K6-1267]|uniref:hypothetical protein n=1 Tax=Psychrobacillus sp. FSL K6-1267 TaxID=2921543 RepID=UPI0030F82920
MEKEFKCIKGFVVDKYDEHEVPIENESFIVPVDSAWCLSEISYMCEVRLESDEYGWLEITLEDLKECFIEIS